MSQIDIELAALLNSLSFEPPITGVTPITIPVVSDIQMSDEDRGYQSDTSTDVSSSSSSARNPSPPCACTLLQAFARYHGLAEGRSQTVDEGQLSSFVFMHREAFLASPSAHAGCSTGFRGLASLLEQRAHHMHGGVGLDAVGMLRTEAWLLSGWSA